MAVTRFSPGGWFARVHGPITDHPKYDKTLSQFHAGGWFMHCRTEITDHPPFVPPEPTGQSFVGFMNSNMGYLKVHQ